MNGRKIWCALIALGLGLAAASVSPYTLAADKKGKNDKVAAPVVASNPAATAFATPLVPLPDASLTPGPRVSLDPPAPGRPSGTAMGEQDFGGPAFPAEGDPAGTAPFPMPPFN